MTSPKGNGGTGQTVANTKDGVGKTTLPPCSRWCAARSADRVAGRCRPAGLALTAATVGAESGFRRQCWRGSHYTLPWCHWQLDRATPESMTTW